MRRDPFERADTDSNMYNRWWCEHAFVFIPAQAMSLQFANTFREFPPRQGAAKFNVEATMDILKEFDNLRVGDMIHVRYTEAIAISVE